MITASRVPAHAQLAIDVTLERELADADRRIGKLERDLADRDRLIATLRQEIALLKASRTNFDLSADETPMLCRLQAG